MLPYIVLAGRTISTYSLFVILDILAAMVYCSHFASIKDGKSADVELAFDFGMIGAFLGAKLLYLLIQLPVLSHDFGLILADPELFMRKYIYSGFVYYGGLYGGVFAVWIYAKRAGVQFCGLVKALLPIVPLVHALGRIGCFCVGCCYGRPTTAFCGVIFRRSQIAPNNIALLPVQLFEAAGEFALFAVVLLGIRRNWSAAVMSGGYIASYGLMRFFLEFLRYDGYRGFVGVLSVSQLISVATVTFGLWLAVSAKFVGLPVHLEK